MEDSSGGDDGVVRKTTTSIFFGKAGLFVLMTGYALFGALLFKTLEEDDTINVPAHVQRTREDCLKELWLITERLNVLYEKNWTRLVTEQLKNFERVVIESGRNDGGVNPSPKWTYGSAFLYSLTLLTTVGYGRLSPRTALGKVVAVIYAVIGVPLMLVLLSALGAMLASCTRKVYGKLTCQRDTYIRSPAVGYHKAPSSPKYCNSRSLEDSASIQLPSGHNTPNHVCKKSGQVEYQEMLSKKAVLATVRATHASRGRCRQNLQRCPELSQATPSWISMTTSESDIEENNDPDENSELGMCTHDTPSRVPLIWRPISPTSRRSQSPPLSPSPSVPAPVVFLLFFSYLGGGAALFASSSDWNFLDAIYFCFIALSTIGIDDQLPSSGDTSTDGQIQLLICCLYLFLGLVLVATCFSLVQEDVSNKCRHVAHNMKLLRH